MAVEDFIAIAVATMTGIGLIGTWIKNGRQETRERIKLEATLKAEIKDVQDDIKHPEYGLSAIKKKVEEQVLYCARTSTSLQERVSSLENNLGRKEPNHS